MDEQKPISDQMKENLAQMDKNLAEEDSLVKRAQENLDAYHVAMQKQSRSKFYQGFFLGLGIAAMTLNIYYNMFCSIIPSQYKVQAGEAIPGKLEVQVKNFNSAKEGQTFLRYDKKTDYHLRFDGTNLMLEPLEKKVDDKSK